MWSKNQNFRKNRNFDQKTKKWSKNRNFRKNRNFGQKSEFFVKIEISVESRDVKGTGFCGTGHVPKLFFCVMGRDGTEIFGTAGQRKKRDKMGHVDLFLNSKSAPQF